MVVYVTYRVPVEVELETETGEIMDVHIVDEKLEGPARRFRLRAAAHQGPSQAARAGARRGGRVARLDLRLLTSVRTMSSVQHPTRQIPTCVTCHPEGVIGQSRSTTTVVKPVAALSAADLPGSPAPCSIRGHSV